MVGRGSGAPSERLSSVLLVMLFSLSLDIDILLMLRLSLQRHTAVRGEGHTVDGTAAHLV